MKINDVVQAWSETEKKCLGWGKIIRIAESDKEEIPLIQLESGKKIWGDRCYYISEKKAMEIGARIFKDIHK